MLFLSRFFMPLLVAVFCLASCSVCKVRLSRTILEIEKEQLACKCSQLKRNDAIGVQIMYASNNEALYAVGPVVTQNGKGIYQYYTNRVGARTNRFAYYNGTKAYLVKLDNLEMFVDSLTVLHISHKIINTKMLEIKRSLQRPPVGGSDSF